MTDEAEFNKNSDISIIQSNPIYLHISKSVCESVFTINANRFANTLTS